MSKRYWVRFFSPGSDPRPLTVPAPYQWWCSGYSSDGAAVICAVVRASAEDFWPALEKWWPGLTPSSCEEISEAWSPGDRFPNTEPTPTSYIEVTL